MPRVTGFEALAWIRNQARWRMLPVMMLSSSDTPKDLEKADKLGASAYFVKPVAPKDLAEELKRFYHFWSPMILSGRLCER